MSDISDNPLLLAVTRVDTDKELEQTAEMLMVDLAQIEQFVDTLSSVFLQVMSEPPPDESGARTFGTHLEGALGAVIMSVFEAGWIWRGAVEGIE